VDVNSSSTIIVGWDSLGFNINFDYHVKSKTWPHPAEVGHVQIYTTVLV